MEYASQSTQHADLKSTSTAPHPYRLKFWAMPAAVAPQPPSTETGWMDWDVLRGWIDQVKAQPFIEGGITEPPTEPTWPAIVVERFTYGPKAEPWIAWKHYVKDEASGELVLLSAKPRVIQFGGEPWVVYLEHFAVAAQHEDPPKENIEKGWCCEMCKRFSLRQGQDWLMQNSHRFDGAEKAQMWVDVTAMITQGAPEIEVPDSLQTFGLCLTKQRLVHTYFPGCAEFKQVAKWTPRYGKGSADTTKEPQPLLPKPEHG